MEEFPQVTNVADLSRALARNYPPELQGARVQGEVTVRFRVLQNGRVDPTSVQVTRTTNESFNQAAVMSVGVLRFRPARIYGTPVRVWVELPIHFSVAEPTSGP